MRAAVLISVTLIVVGLAVPALADDPSRKADLESLAEKGAGTRAKRMMRWDLYFGNADAKDYLEYAATLGMYLVVPDNKGDPLHVPDLKARPAKLVPAKIKEWNRSFFTDEAKDSCASVATELKLEFVPIALFFFYPRDLEDMLLKKELAFKGRKEQEIKRTKFKVSFKDGKPQIEVVEQQVFDAPKKP